MIVPNIGDEFYVTQELINWLLVEDPEIVPFFNIGDTVKVSATIAQITPMGTGKLLAIFRLVFGVTFRIPFEDIHKFLKEGAKVPVKKWAKADWDKQ